MEKKITFRNSKGQKLVGILHPAASKELFVICHGFDDSKNGPVIKWMAEGLSKKGYTAFRFDFTGHGESEGDKGEDYMQEVDDIRSIINYFRSSFPAITLVGGSLGGLVATTAAAQGAGIKRLVLFNPFIYLDEYVVWNMRKYLILLFLAAPFSRKAYSQLHYYYSEMKPGNITTPTLIVCGTHDKIVSCRHSKRLFTEIKADKTLVENAEIDHGLSKKPYADFAVRTIINWVK